MERIKQTVFKHKDIMYVPKFQTPDAYVSPGYGRHHDRVYTAEQLTFLGAKEAKYPLVDQMMPIKKGKK